MPNCVKVFLYICACAVSAQAQSVIVLPSGAASSQTASVLGASSLTSTAAFSVSSGTSQVLAPPQGGKYYVISSTAVTAFDANFGNPHSVGALAGSISVAALSPDGRRLLVGVNGVVHLIDTATDTDSTPAGIVVNGAGFSPIDVAFSFDSGRAFVLGSLPAGGSLLAAIDLTQGTLIGTLPVGGLASGVAIGPNGLLYVSTVFQILEINPTTFTSTVNGVISVNAHPGKLVFTPDGHYALAVNLTPVNGGSEVLLLDLLTHTVANFIPSAGFNITFDKLFVISNNLVYAYSSQNQSLYSLTIGANNSFSIGVASFPGVSQGNLTAVALSSEIANSNRAAPQALYLATSTTLYRIDPLSGQVTSQGPISAAPGSIVFIPASTIGGTPAQLLAYGNQQAVATGAQSLPLVVQALDANGSPIAGAAVNFTASVADAVLTPATATTGANGFAATTVTAPASGGLVTVTASAGAATSTFTLTVGTTSSGGGATAVHFSIVSGQGQILFENQNGAPGSFGAPFVLLATDASGNPVPDLPVTFTVTSGFGGIYSPEVDNTTPQSVTVYTDSTGLATADFQAVQIQPGTGFEQDVITATADSANTTTFYVTVTPQSFPPIVQYLGPPVGAVISGAVGSTVKSAFQVQVVSSQGFPIPNVSLQVGTNLDPTMFPNLSCADPSGGGTALTDSKGIATCDVVLSGAVGTAQIVETVGYFSQRTGLTVTTTLGAISAIKIVNGNNQTGSGGQSLAQPFIIQVTDASGNPLPAVAVSWQVIAGGITLKNVVSTTDVNGRASATGVLGNTAGSAVVKATAGTATATFTTTVNIPVGGIQIVSGNSQTALAGSAFAAPVVVRVTDSNGNPVAGTLVAFSIASGAGSISAPSVSTDAAGQASTAVQAGSGAGVLTVTASAGAYATSFTLTSRLPGPVITGFLNGASFSSGGSNCPVANCVAPGEIITITGMGLAPGVQGVVLPPSSGQLPTTLSAVSVLFGSTPAPIFAVSNVNGVEQISVQAPFDLAPGGLVSITVNNANGSTSVNNVSVQAFNPGIFTSGVVVANGRTYPIAVAVRSDGTYVSATNPAHRGEDISIFATGLGQTVPVASTNSVGVTGQNLFVTPVVGLNNAGVPLMSAYYQPGTVGVYVVTLTVPNDTTAGPYQPVGLVLTDSAGRPFFAPSTYIPIQ